MWHSRESIELFIHQPEDSYSKRLKSTVPGIVVRGLYTVSGGQKVRLQCGF